MHQNLSAESNRGLPKYDPFHTACWVPWLCCRSPIHHSNILVCQQGPLDNTQTASQNLFVNLSRVYRNGCTREVPFAKWSEMYLTCMDSDTAACRKQNFHTGKLCAEFFFFFVILQMLWRPCHPHINSHFQRKRDWVQHLWLQESSCPSLSQDLTPPFAFSSKPGM